MAIISGGFRRLAYFKTGDNAWTIFAGVHHIIDVICYGDQFYFVNLEGVVFSYDLNHPDPKVVEVAQCPESPWAMRRYLVESSGELLQVCRFTRFDVVDDNIIKDFVNNGFDVFKLDLVAFKWIKMNTLHGRVLFLGRNSSYSLLASDFPGCKPNSVYFTDDYYERFVEDYGLGPRDMGVFNLEDGSHEPHYRTGSKKIPAHIWIEPIL
ncbi:hypothetical protein AQUCO_00700614v1 [Aquilegia coerulea]|uniref:KIB1-4 beta-propeller domain-containing protein n=1 Tax=Aquilegia coerulea TaxID=218851 RepID=A0A2G5ELG3_AQUCA|nr:hypothetical protein AQUCO_00700614v1 [Aquilegia coerulea]